MIFRQLEATNFPQRAKGLADEIQARKPDLIGLQDERLIERTAVHFGQPAPRLIGTSTDAVDVQFGGEDGCL